MQERGPRTGAGLPPQEMCGGGAALPLPQEVPSSTGKLSKYLGPGWPNAFENSGFVIFKVIGPEDTASEVI